MQLLTKKTIRISGIVLGVLLVIVMIGGTIVYFKRENLLHAAIDKAIAKAKRDYNLDVKIGSAHFTGLSTVSFDGITIVPENRDSLLHIENFEVSIKMLPLISGKVKLGAVKLDNGWLHLTNIDSVKNFDFIFKHKKDSTQTSTGSDLSVVADNLLNEVFYKVPDDLNLKNFTVKYHSDSINVTLLAKYAVIDDSKLSSEIDINNNESVLHFAGKMRPSDRYFDINLYADNKPVEFPFIEKKYGLKLHFDTIGVKLNKAERSDGETRVYSSWSIRNLLINHPKIASTDIIVPAASLDANVFIGQSSISLDSSSVAHLKDVAANAYFKYTKPGKIKAADKPAAPNHQTGIPAGVYELKIGLPMTNAQKIFNSFPPGTFDALAGIQVSGKLAYNLNFYLDTFDPDNLKFDSNLQQDNFNIVKFGGTDINKLNSTFVYTPYEKYKPMPSRIIGPENPNYTPLADISLVLQHAVMTAEDPSFYSHHGFVPEAFRKSIIVDFKEKMFKRGGSTISMQLVKNAFLSRQKTATRKIEETLIVWMIENKHIITKSRMLEVYFNIIEWGNNVYGIGEAARFYFGKTPAELDLGESIYLASIVPKPKTGLYAFAEDGSLKDYLRGYFHSLGDMMANQHYINLMDSVNYGYYDVRLKAGQRRHVTINPRDTAAIAKALKQDDEESDAPMTVVPQQTEKKPNFFQRLFGGGKKDTTRKKDVAQDTVKSKKQLRQEKRAEKKKEKEAQKKLNERGLY